MELSKKDKKTCLALFNLAMEREMETGLTQFEALLQQWRAGAFADNGTAYRELYRQVARFNKHIAERYERVSASVYLWKVLELLHARVIAEHELSAFSEETRNEVLRLMASRV